MGLYRLPTGRELYLVRLAMEGTYAGQMEGTPETVSPTLWPATTDRASLLLPPGKPLIVAPTRLPLPRWLWVAELGSQRGSRTDDPDYSSRLCVCWYTSDSAFSVDQMIESLLPHLDWERMAEDYDVMMF